MPQNRLGTGQFRPGTSGNPGGRPKRTQEEKDALERIRALAEETPEELRRMIKGKTTPPAIRLRAIEVVLNRTYGKPPEYVNVSGDMKHDPDLLEDIKAELRKYEEENK